MTVTAFRVQNFMGFEDSGWLELRPITLLFGRNSSGKSALIRALLLLRQSLESVPGGDALVFVRDDGLDLGDYSELVLDHDTSKPMSFWFRIRFSRRDDDDYLQRALDGTNYFTVSNSIPVEERPVEQILTVRLIFGQSVQGVTELEGVDIYASNGDLILRADKRHTDTSSNSGGSLWTVATDFFDPSAQEPDSPFPGLWQHVEFFTQKGFLPGVRLEQNIFKEIEEDTSSENAASALGDNFQNIWIILGGMRRAISLFLEQLDYLGPLRSAPQRFYYVAGQDVGSLERGKNFVRNLTKADLPSIEDINHWLKVAGTPYRLQLQSLDERKRLYALRLLERTENKPGELSVNIREVGFGITQMLPIIAQAVLAKPGDTLIVEQPELHLHPRAQTELGNLFIAIAQKGVRCFVETHSEHLLLRLQKQIAKTTAGHPNAAIPGQMLLPNQLAVYFINRKERSIATRIEIGSYGDLLSTPEGFEDFFSDDMLETAERMRARLGFGSEEKR